MNQNVKDMNAILLDEETISQLEEISRSNDPEDVQWIDSLKDYGIIGWKKDSIYFKDNDSKLFWIGQGYEIL